jgi:hypothetical protein
MATKRKTGAERLTIAGRQTDFSLIHYWQWSASDVLGNTARGVLAEFIVATALGVADKIRNEWDPYDLLTPDGIKIEVKSAAYLQSWHQAKFSTITFGIHPAQAWDPKTNKLSGDSVRRSDVYIFYLLAHRDKATVDPLNLDQWRFFVLPRKVLDEKLPHQKKIGLNGLLALAPVEAAYDGIRAAVESCYP